MTDAKSAVTFRGEQKLGSFDRSAEAAESRARETRGSRYRAHAFCGHVVTRESQFIIAFRDRCMSCGLLPRAKYSQRERRG